MGSKARRCLFGAPDVDLLEQEIIRMQHLEIARARELYDVDLGVLAIQLEAQTEPKNPSQSGII
jgi:hypothetical protein